MKGFKALFELGDTSEEITVYAETLEEAHEKAAETMGVEPVRVRPMVSPSINWEVAQ
jgi:hypothetical protein